MLLANHAAVAIENARFYEEVRGSATDCRSGLSNWKPRWPSVRRRSTAIRRK